MAKNNWNETIIEVTTYEGYKVIRGFLKDNQKVKDRLKEREIDVTDIEKLKFNIQLFHGEKRDIMKETYQIIMKDGNKKVLHFSYTNTNGLSDK